MNFLAPDFWIGVLSCLFTVLILSYVIGDNPAFRLAIHTFIGISAGYVAAIVLLQVIANKLIVPLATPISLILQGDGEQWKTLVLLLVPLFLGVMLLTKLSPRAEWLGRPVVAFLVGTGAAAAVAGAITGTIYPQVADSAGELKFISGRELDLVAGAVILLGTIATLAYFQFTVIGKKPSVANRGWVATITSVFSLIGQSFIAITLGTLFAGVFSAALAALIDRIQSIILFVQTLFH
jgi:hypothetical protein